jgi:hypothetical protein
VTFPGVSREFFKGGSNPNLSAFFSGREEAARKPIAKNFHGAQKLIVRDVDDSQHDLRRGALARLATLILWRLNAERMG